MSTEFYLVGRVRRAHGLRGELVIEALTDAPDAIFAAGRRVFAGTRNGEVAEGLPELQIQRATPFKGGFIVAFEGIGDRSTAEAWRERTLLLPESEVEPPSEGQVFIHELVGMRVIHATGDAIGLVTEVFELPQGLLIEVRRVEGKPVLLPFDDKTVTDVDVAQRIIHVDPVEGLLD